ncbi:MAG: SPOR domain-containing protein [Prevotella sp.]|nr:SPOR domain-containing protein [Prevotella sp.]
MKRLATIFILCAGCLAASAQSTFTERVQKQNAGEGKVTITHDKAIDDLVNGQRTPAEKPKVTVPHKQTEPSNISTATTQEVNIITPDSVDTRKKIMKGYKVNGYRVQVFAGGNSRNDRIKTEKIGSEIKALFPDVPVYVHFYSPRWVCRMGNYRTYEEAHEMLTRVKNNGYESATIIKGKITVQYP